jgi:elongation factor 3
MIAEFDGKLASAAGDKKALTRANVEEYLSGFGLDAELASHSHIKGLSGGQKVKLVLAAAMWNHPHFLIMDEPTNYLDRDSLGALAGAIKEFQGGVLLISHNSEFTGALCPETWAVDNGVVTVHKVSDDQGSAKANREAKEEGKEGENGQS